MESSSPAADQFLYRRIEAECREKIASGEWRAGVRLPSELELAKRFGCNFHTVRRALALLVADHLIERHKGRGSYVLNGVGANAPKERRAIGILLQMTPENHYLFHLLNGLNDCAGREQVSLNIRAVESIGPELLPALEELEKQGCSAVIVPWLSSNADRGAVIRMVIASPLPIVLPQPFPGFEENFFRPAQMFDSDGRSAIRMSCEYFQRLGYGRIGFLSNGRNGELFAGKLIEYIREMNRRNLPCCAFLADSETQYDAAIDAFAAYRGDFALICDFDEIAVRFCRAAQRRQFRIPEDFAVLGYNNDPVAADMAPPLSTIQCPYDDIAAAILRHALALGDNQLAQTDAVYPSPFILRDSCGGKLRAPEQLAEIAARSQLAAER